jgi:LPXTG-motif cell wall-anchored protein
MRMRTIDGRRRTAAVLTGTAAAAALMALVAVTPAAAEGPPPPPDDPTTIPETTIPSDTGAEEPAPEETSTTVPETTIPSDTDSTVAAPTTSTTTPTTIGEGEAPTTTDQAPDEPATTLPPVPPSTDLACVDGFVPMEHTFLIDESIEEGETFDDPASDFSVTFTQVDFVEDHLAVTFEASHPVSQLELAGLYAVKWFAFFYGEPEPVVVRTVELEPAFGRSIAWAAFCFIDADAIGATPPVSPTVTAAPPEPVDGEPPVTATVVTPVDDESYTSGGTLPDTGSDALPLVLAGVGLVTVGGGLLLGRRLRRSAV